MQFADEIVNIDGINIKDFVEDILNAIKKRHFEATDDLCSPDVTNVIGRTKVHSALKSEKMQFWEVALKLTLLKFFFERSGRSTCGGVKKKFSKKFRFQPLR